MLLLRVTRLIPSWWLAVVGSLLVGCSAIFGSAVLLTLDQQIQDTLRQIENKEVEARRYWNQHIEWSDLMRDAALLQAAASTADPPWKGVLQERASESATRVLNRTFTQFVRQLAFCAEPKAQIPPELAILLNKAKVRQSSCYSWLENLKKNDFSSYQDLEAWHAFIILFLATRISDTHDSIQMLKNDAGELGIDRRRYQLIQMCFSLFGLVFVLFKDVPIWKQET